MDCAATRLDTDSPHHQRDLVSNSVSNFAYGLHAHLHVLLFSSKQDRQSPEMVQIPRVGRRLGWTTPCHRTTWPQQSTVDDALTADEFHVGHRIRKEHAMPRIPVLAARADV